MRRFAATVVIALVCAMVGTAWAASEDERKSGFYYKKGLRYESSDGRFSFNLNNRVQVRFTQENPDEGESKGSFRLRRFKVKATGHIFDHWEYKLQVNFAGQGDEFGDVVDGQVVLGQDDILEDAYFQYTKHHWFQPWLGQGKVKAGRERLNSSGKLLFVDRVLLSDYAEVPRDIGVALVGHDKNKRFEYNVGMYNGNALNQKENDNGKYAYSGRVVWTPFGEYKLEEGALDYPDKPKLAVGLDGYANTITTEDGTDLDAVIYGPEFAFKIKGFYTQFEYYRVDVDLEGGQQGQIDTGYVQASYLLPGRRIEFAGRIGTVDPDEVAQAEVGQQTNSTLGFNYYFHGHDFKVQADLTQQDDKSDANEDALVFRAQVQFVF